MRRPHPCSGNDRPLGFEFNEIAGDAIAVISCAGQCPQARDAFDQIAIVIHHRPPQRKHEELGLAAPSEYTTSHARRAGQAWVPDLGLGRDEVVLVLCPDVAVGEAGQRSAREVGAKSVADVEATFEVSYLNRVVRTSLGGRDVIVWSRHESLVAGLVCPAAEDVRQAGLALAPSSTLTEESRLMTERGPGSLTGIERCAVGATTCDPFDQHMSTVAGHPERTLMPQRHPVIFADLVARWSG
jgi:hypothetical protein